MAKQVLREQCLHEGLCVTIEPTTYIYTGGEEVGYVVGILNYPRFPATQATFIRRAHTIAAALVEKTFQQSALIVMPDTTVWLSNREDPK